MAPFEETEERWPVKYIIDGTPIERSAAMDAPYADDGAARGELNYPMDDIAAMVRDAARGERQLLVHAVGDRAIAVLFDAMERTPADWPSRRVRVARCQFFRRLLHPAHPDDAPALLRSAVSASSPSSLAQRRSLSFRRT